jgi:hypothetical protein
MLAEVDYSYLPWEKYWFFGGLGLAVALVALAIVTYGFWNPGNRSDGDRADTACGLNLAAFVCVVLALLVPVINREARVNGAEFRAEVALFEEQVDQTDYDAIYISAQNDSFTVVLNNCRLDAYYNQYGDRFDTYFLEHDYRSARYDEHTFDDAADIIKFDPRCRPPDREVDRDGIEAAA